MDSTGVLKSDPNPVALYPSRAVLREGICFFFCSGRLGF